MPLKTALWAGFFLVTALAALVSPIWGIVGYMGTYTVGPDRQWWEAPLHSLGLRYSLTLAICTALGIALNWGKLRFGHSRLHGQEKLMLCFLALLWLMTLMAAPTVGRYESAGIDHPTVKLLKVMFFTLMLTHVATDSKKLNWLLWAFVMGALLLGLKAYATPYGQFSRGRLEGIGGPDFGDANRFGGYMAGMLFLVGAQFIRSGRLGRILCFLAGGFTANAIVLTRSRGAFVGVLGGIALAIWLAPRNYRAKIFGALLIGGLGGLFLADPQFLDRAGTINRAEEQRDQSAQSRLEIWKGGLKMLIDHPLGVGPGNFYQYIGQYAPDHPGRDAHNTLVRCAGELGFPGLILFCVIVINALRLSRKAMQESMLLPTDEGRGILWASYGTATGLVAMLTYGLTGTLVYTEYLWWLLALPVCLIRTLENAQDDYESQVTDADPDDVAPSETDSHGAIS